LRERIPSKHKIRLRLTEEDWIEYFTNFSTVPWWEVYREEIPALKRLVEKGIIEENKDMWICKSKMIIDRC